MKAKWFAWHFHYAHEDFFLTHREVRCLKNHTAAPWQRQCLAYLTGRGNPICMFYSRAHPLTLKAGVSGSLKVKLPPNVWFLGHELSLSVTSLSTSRIWRASLFLVCCRGPCLVIRPLFTLPRPPSHCHGHYSSSLCGNKALRYSNRTRIHTSNTVTRKGKLEKKENPLQ